MQYYLKDNEFSVLVNLGHYGIYAQVKELRDAHGHVPTLFTVEYIHDY
jgi:hypothetical protein